VVAVVGALARHSGTHQLSPRQATEKWVLKGPMLTSHAALESNGENATNSNEASLLSHVTATTTQLAPPLQSRDVATPRPSNIAIPLVHDT
jgi:hypothetical protein